ncbi:MAG: glucose-6-phosphate dehydrogenase [Nitrospira sp.]|nr:glucose-6-phosphate dehydrogenase [Nitrospira sp.]
MPVSQSDALVIFGASGDLAYKKIFPALQAMVRRGRLDAKVIGVAKTDWSLEQFRARVGDSLAKQAGMDVQSFTKLSESLRYVRGDYGEPTTFEALRKELGAAAHPLYYLAVPPSVFVTVIEGLAKAGCVRDARVVVEKPFGRDLASAQALNRALRASFPEQSIFRIDHYLGKEPVQNLLHFRFANPIFEGVWNSRHIERVQITMAERFGVAGRGRFYEEAGAIRDVVQNHMLMVIACLTMPEPAGNDHESIRGARVNALNTIRPLNPSDIVRGQFRGYRREQGVAPDSAVETFAALRFFLDSDRWTDVPFYVRVGKCLPVTATELLIEFKRPCCPILDEHEPPLADYVRFQLSPEVSIALGTNVKVPGEAMVGKRTELVAHHGSGDDMDPYERLLGDAMKGDAWLFAREDGVEAAWRAVDPILTSASPLYEYDPNTWGPQEADRLIGGDGWHNPLGKHSGADRDETAVRTRTG